MQRRMELMEVEVRELRSLRTSIESTPVVPPAPAHRPTEQVAPEASLIVNHKHFARSSYGKLHKVAMGYPSSPCIWTTACGWFHGFSTGTSFEEEMPALYKSLCEKCFKCEREARKASARGLIAEVG